MSSTEEYLDNLLKEALESEEKNLKNSVNDTNDNIVIGDNTEMSNEENIIPGSIVGDENADPNRALGADEIAALFAEAGITEFDTTKEAVEVGQAEILESDVNIDMLQEELAGIEMTEKNSIEEISAHENVEQTADINRALGADEIAALFAEAGISEELVESKDTDLFAESETMEETPIEDVSEAVDETDEDSIEELMTEEMNSDEMVSQNETSVLTEDKSEDLNQALGDDEIAALFAEAGIPEEPAMPVEMTKPEEENTDKAEEDSVNYSDEEELTELVMEETGDSDVADLLELMSDGNDDLAEISDLLKKSDSNEPIQIEENVAEEIIPEKKEKKKKEKRSLFGKKKKKKDAEESVEVNLEETNIEATAEINAESVKEEVAEQDIQLSGSEENTEQDEFADLLSQLGGGEFTTFEDFASLDSGFEEQLSDIPEKDGMESMGMDGSGENSSEKRKKGAIARFFDMLTEEVEEEEIPEVKEKSKKEKKAKKSKKKNKTENEELIDELDAEDEQGKKGKKKKAKKVKIPKKPMEDYEEPSGKKLPKKMVIRICVLCASLLVLIVLVSNGIISFTSLKTARAAYYNSDYETAYQNLIGKKLNENDQLILEKTTLIMRVQRKYDSYLNYVALGNDDYACNALLNGYKLYLETYEQAMEHSVDDEVDSLKRLIVDALWNSYGISEEMAVELIGIEDTYEYQESLYEILQISKSEN